MPRLAILIAVTGLLGCSLVVGNKLDERKTDARLDGPGPGPGPDGRGEGRQPDRRINPQPVVSLDVLFVIDKSASIGPKQAAFVSQLQPFLESLRSYKLGPVAAGQTCTLLNQSGCKPPDLRIGIVSTDLGAGKFSLPSCETLGGDGARLAFGPGKMAPPGCATATDPWIALVPTQAGLKCNVANAKSPEPLAQVAEAFACIGALGESGCGFEQPLEAARKALKGNPGFIRPDAALAVVVFTDEDDCSAARADELFDPSQQGLTDPFGPLTSFRCFEFGIVCKENGRQPGPRNGCVPGLDYLFKIDDYVGFFRSFKADDRVFFLAIGGPVPPALEVALDGLNPKLKPTCSSAAMGGADPGVRLSALAERLGGGLKGAFFNPGNVTACSTSYAPALKLLAEYINLAQ